MSQRQILISSFVIQQANGFFKPVAIVADVTMNKQDEFKGPVCADEEVAIEQKRNLTSSLYRHITSMGYTPRFAPEHNTTRH